MAWKHVSAAISNFSVSVQNSEIYYVLEIYRGSEIRFYQNQKLYLLKIILFSTIKQNNYINFS
jgi:hypothetical protein